MFLNILYIFIIRGYYIFKVKNINYNNNWNGKGNYNNSERELEDDGYYYSIKATDESGRVQVFKGFVLIQR